MTSGSAASVSPMAFGTAATIGKREVQEDSVGWSRERLDLRGDLPALSIIADGMGGHAAGEVASKIAVDGFLDAYRRDAPGGATVLIDSLDWANGQIAGHVAAHPETDGMGCTLVAVEVNADSSAYRGISVGDSLLLSVTPAGIDRLNADHSYREERERLAAAGESLDGAPAANVLRSALMGFDVPLIDNQAEWRAFVPGETLILATDGLETLSPDRVLDIARAHVSASDVANALIASVNASGKPRQDNTSVAVIRPPALQTPETAEATQPPMSMASLRDEAEEPRTLPAGTSPPRETTTMISADAISAAESARTLPPIRPLPAPSAKPAAAARAPARKTGGTGRSARVAMILLFGILLGGAAAWLALTRFADMLPPAMRPAAKTDAAPVPARQAAPAPVAANPVPTTQPVEASNQAREAKPAAGPPVTNTPTAAAAPAATPAKPPVRTP